MSDATAAMFKRIGASIGLGLGIGFVIMGIVTAITLPASYMMNKLIYHHWSMRFMTGLIAASFNIIALVIILVLVLTGTWPKPYYFGLFPIVQTAGPTAYSGWLAFLFSIVSYIFHPFMMFFTGSAEDKEGYKNSLQGMLLDKPLDMTYKNGDKYVDGAVCEKFFEDSRIAGTKVDYPSWEKSVNDLVEAGREVFGADSSDSPGSSGSSGPAPPPSAPPVPIDFQKFTEIALKGRMAERGY